LGVLSQSLAGLASVYRNGWSALTLAAKPLCDVLDSWAVSYLLRYGLSAILDKMWHTLSTNRVSALIIRLINLNPNVFIATKIASVGVDVTQMVMSEMPDDAEIQEKLGDGAAFFSKNTKTMLRFIWEMGIFVGVKVLMSSLVVTCRGFTSVADLTASMIETGHQFWNKTFGFVASGAEVAAESNRLITSGEAAKNVQAWATSFFGGLFSPSAVQFAAPDKAPKVINTLVGQLNELQFLKNQIESASELGDDVTKFNEIYQSLFVEVDNAGTIRDNFKDKIADWRSVANNLNEGVEAVKNILPQGKIDGAVEQSLVQFFKMISRVSSQVSNRADARILNWSKALFDKKNVEMWIRVMNLLMPVGILVLFGMSALKGTKILKLDPNPDPELERGVESWLEPVKLREEVNDDTTQLEDEVEQQQALRKKERAQKAVREEEQKKRTDRVQKAVENEQMWDFVEKTITKKLQPKSKETTQKTTSVKKLPV